MPVTPPDPTPLTRHEQSVLAAIATHEHRHDRRFAEGLAVGSTRDPGSVRGRAIALGAVLAAVAGVLLLPAAWLFAVVAFGLLVVAPTALVVWALRQGRVYPD